MFFIVDELGLNFSFIFDNSLFNFTYSFIIPSLNDDNWISLPSGNVTLSKKDLIKTSPSAINLEPILDWVFESISTLKFLSFGLDSNAKFSGITFKKFFNFFKNL